MTDTNLLELPVGSIVKDQDGDEVLITGYNEDWSGHVSIREDDEALFGRYLTWFGRDVSRLPESDYSSYLEAEDISGVVRVGPEDGAASQSGLGYNEQLLKLAIEFKRPVTFSYSKGDGKVIETRRLAPDHVEDGLVVGTDLDRRAPRAFRLDRINGEVSL